MKHFLAISLPFFILLICNQEFGQKVNLNIAEINNNDYTIKSDTSNYATIYVYRSRKWKYHLDVYSVNVGDSIIYRIKHNTKYAIKIYKEGPLEIWAKSGGKRAAVDVNVKFGQDYYIKCTIDPGFAMGYPELTLVSKGEGKDEYDAIKDTN